MIRTLSLILLLASPVAAAELRGHGGPVRALAVAGDAALTGSFDGAAILWSARDGGARQVLRFHAGGVNAVAFIPGGLATGGEDGRVALWRPGETAPYAAGQAHGAPVVGLALSPDGARLASAGWDGAARLLDLATGTETRLEHGAPVNGVAFLPDGRLATVAQDLALRLWPADGGPAVRTGADAPLNALAAAGATLAAGGADGAVRLYDAAGAETARIATGGGPIVGLALSADGGIAAASSVTGDVTLIDVAARRVLRAIDEVGPVWSVAFAPDGATLMAGGGDRVVRRWAVATGEAVGRTEITTPDPLAGLGDSRGAQVFRACAACHTLGPGDEGRAGPTLHGVFGRRVGTAPGYPYSEALRGMDIVWTPETVSALFEHGPAAYTPGTTMPEQRIGSAEDRAALMDFLAERTR
jgi:cytochrome c